MNILLTGIDGYVGWPTALRLSKVFPNAQITGIDNLGRRKWVEECGSVSAIPIYDMNTRIQTAKKHGFGNIHFVEGDLVDRSFVYDLLKQYRPAVILHLASQPSAPYSQLSGEKANYTQHNNNQATRNLLWGMKEMGLPETHFIETTTTGVYGAPEFPIPEGFLEVNYKGGKDTIPFPGLGGSWYHISKCHDVSNLLLANKQWKFSISDIRTSIVFGTETEETSLDPQLATRFDFDFYFGVVVNRFCAMALAGYPITIYGKGDQKKPQISLEDAVQSLVHAVKLPANHRMEVYNQTTDVISIGRIAELICEYGKEMGVAAEVIHIPNPRVEKEEHEMEMENAKFLKLLGEIRMPLEEGIRQTLKSLLPYRGVFIQHKECFIEKQFLKEKVGR